MPTAPNFDDINQSVIYIPYESEQDSEKDSQDYNPYEERDLPGGYEVRMDAYRVAWKRCLDRVQSVIDALNAPIIEEIVKEVDQAYEDVLPGLPFPELPVIAISGASSGSAFLDNISRRLDHNSEEDDSRPETYVVHLHPPDCLTLMLTMKTLVTGFVDRPPDGHEVKRKATASLANYDISLLEAWYRAFQDTREKLPRLVVFMHDFEQFESAIVEDVFAICNERIPDLPLVFIVSLSSPPSPSYLHITYPRATLALLRVDTYSIPSGIEVLEKIITETFFDIGFDPDVMIGPATLDFLADFFCRHTSSVDAVLTVLQLAHLKHFDEPLAILLYNELLGTKSSAKAVSKLSSPGSFPFLDSLLSWSVDPQLSDQEDDWPSTEVAGLLNTVRRARVAFRSRSRGVKIALGILCAVQNALVGLEVRNAETPRTPLALMSAALGGELGREAKHLETTIAKLSEEKVKTLVEALDAYLSGIAQHVDDHDAAYSAAVEGLDAGGDAWSAAALGTWLMNFLDEYLVNLEDAHLWDIWYMGSTPFPSELLNPSLRTTVISGVFDPYSYISASADDDETQLPSNTPRRRALWELPDTSILFRRYLEAGRLINVYDWYESFAMVIDSQRRHMEKRASASVSADEASEGDGGEGEERWKMHVQARFVRALHELDFLGFVRHTGRKADHVMRTVFDTAL
ncbi:hypothetical protein FA95DRAFT_1542047 [Auriscalpium vulgare]|uniref:Uncharacterized protein n=1 Tax=Auriscalpium vulgare TaxID=40419 RepID=A0ACB8RRX3_9AGAM|nr:hypothetical protein FA95DRAFT_1542047 [Auriscalpium vulgare]